MKLIMENWRKYNDNPFGLLCEQYDKKIITEEQLFERWEKDTLKEIQELSEVNWEKEAAKLDAPEGETTKKRGIIGRINDWILMKLVQLESLFKRGLKLAIKAIATVIRGIKRFCSDRSICKLAVATLVVVGTFLIIAMINEAHAKIAHPTKPDLVLSQDIVDVMKGDIAVLYDSLMDAKEAMDDTTLGMTTADLAETMQKINEMQETVGTESFAKPSDEATGNVKKIWEHLIDNLEGVEKSAKGEAGELKKYKAIELLKKLGEGAEATADRSALGVESSVKLKGVGKVKDVLPDPGLDPFRAVVDKPEGGGGIKFGKGDIEYGKLRTQRN